MAKSHLSKEELRHDAVQDTLLESVEFLRKHLAWVIGISAAVVVIGAAALGYYTYRQHVAQQQSAEFYEAEKLLNQPNVALEERIKQTEAAMAAYAKANPGSRLTPAAYTYMARFAFERKDIAGAEADLQKALAHPETDAVQRAVVLLSLGKLREAQGKPADALTYFNQIDEKRFPDAKAYAIGTAELAMGKAEDARKQFQIAATQQPSTPVSAWAKDALDYLP